MGADDVLQSLWDWCLGHLGVAGVASPAFLLTAVVAGVYLPGIVFSFVDVVISKRLTLAQCWAVYWRAMKWYGSLYVVAMIVFWAAPMTLLSQVPTAAPAPFEFFRDIVLYFLLGDVVSYFWHRVEHANRPYMRNVHYYHHVDTPPLTIWTAMVVHPVEGFSVFTCFHIYGILFPIHPLTFAVGAFSVTAVNMITHCGYRLPVYDWIFATSREHDIHHASREPRNISVMLSICDRMFGTFEKARRTDPVLRVG
jgi:sterol desaturase/sphingolipid hydroxylase (fatty acid hydroxylase superfamily)